MRHTDTQRIDWLERGGVERLLCEHMFGGSAYRYRVRIRALPTFEFSRREFTMLRDAIDFGIDTPETQ